MKRMIPFLLMASVCMPVCLASLVDEPETIDGYLTKGEYLGGGVTLEHHEKLFVIGGGGSHRGKRLQYP